MTVAFACDHGGFPLKEQLLGAISACGHTVLDLGTNSPAAVDYPDYAAILAGDIMGGKLDRGVLICGTGIGMSITANKFPGVRAAVVWDEFTARMSRAHNDANVICLGARVLNHHRAAELVNLWLDAEFEGNRHRARLEKIREIEKKLFAR